MLEFVLFFEYYKPISISKIEQVMIIAKNRNLHQSTNCHKCIAMISKNDISLLDIMKSTCF